MLASLEAPSTLRPSSITLTGPPTLRLTEEGWGLMRERGLSDSCDWTREAGGQVLALVCPPPVTGPPPPYYWLSSHSPWAIT